MGDGVETVEDVLAYLDANGLLLGYGSMTRYVSMFYGNLRHDSP